MRNICIAVIGSLLCAGLCQAQPASTSPSNPSLDALAREYTTPAAIGRWLRTEFRFVRDRDQFGVVERWQSPEEFLAVRRGDCEDFALLARELLARNGVEAFVFSLFGGDGYAHTVCAFRDGAGYSVVTRRGVQTIRAASLEALATRLHPAWTFGGIVERDGVRGRFIRELHNPDPAIVIGAEPFAF
jgi:hypothetical protein